MSINLSPACIIKSSDLVLIGNILKVIPLLSDFRLAALIGATRAVCLLVLHSIWSTVFTHTCTYSFVMLDNRWETVCFRMCVPYETMLTPSEVSAEAVLNICGMQGCIGHASTCMS